MEFKMNDKTYNVLKWIAQVVLPALITFYGIVAKTLNLSYTQEIIIIASAFDTLLGTILGISTANYKATIDEVTNE